MFTNYEALLNDIFTIAEKKMKGESFNTTVSTNTPEDKNKESFKKREEDTIFVSKDGFLQPPKGSVVMFDAVASKYKLVSKLPLQVGEIFTDKDTLNTYIYSGSGVNETVCRYAYNPNTKELSQHVVLNGVISTQQYRLATLTEIETLLSQIAVTK